MAWQGIVGHDAIVDRFHRALARRRLASSFLFVGLPGIGKSTFALKLAQALLCEIAAEHELAPCNNCSACRQVQALTHPDLVVVSKSADKSSIPIEAFIGDREHRMSEGLCHAISLKPFHGGRKVAIVDDADFLNQEGANCLLKTLEEPPPQSVLILVGSSQQRQLPTIRSRCQIVRFLPLTEQQVSDLLVSHNLSSTPEQADLLASMSRGSLQRAVQLADPRLHEFRQQLLEHLSTWPQDSVEFAKTLTAVVDEAGQAAPPRRDRLRLILDLAIEFYTLLLRTALGSSSNRHDTSLEKAVGDAIKAASVDVPRTLRHLRACMDAQRHVFANANQSTLIDWWSDQIR